MDLDTYCSSAFYYLFIYYFRERGKEREREKRRCGGEISTGCLPYRPGDQGSNPNPGMCRDQDLNLRHSNN